jgi:hypothetical protein
MLSSKHSQSQQYLHTSDKTDYSQFKNTAILYGKKIVEKQLYRDTKLKRGNRKCKCLLGHTEALLEANYWAAGDENFIPLINEDITNRQ